MSQSMETRLSHLFYYEHFTSKKLKHSRNQTDFMVLEVLHSYLYKLHFSYSYESIHTNTYLHTLYITYYTLHEYTPTYHLYKISMRNPYISYSLFTKLL